MEESKSSDNVSVLYKDDTVYCSDSVEWCPHEPCKHIFVCANYQLDSNSSVNSTARFGKIRLYSIDQTNGLTLHQVIDTDAVLDQKWCQHQINGYSTLAVVTGKNKLEIYRLDPELPELQLITCLQNGPNFILLLSVDWSTGKYESDTPQIVASDSKGNINLFEYSNDQLVKRYQWKAHSFEAWISAFYYWDTNVLFTGGDDAKLAHYDMRQGIEPVMKSSAHFAGVTCIHSNINKEFILATGSYDSNMKIWDIRNMKQPLSTTTLPVSVWRLKWNPTDPNHILAACMKGGFHIVETTDLTKPKIVMNYHEHEDLAYGADWCYLNKDEIKDFEHDGNQIIAACSFYDHKVSVAKVNLDNFD